MNKTYMILECMKIFSRIFSSINSDLLEESMVVFMSHKKARERDSENEVVYRKIRLHEIM